MVIWTMKLPMATLSWESKRGSDSTNSLRLRDGEGATNQRWAGGRKHFRWPTFSRDLLTRVRRPRTGRWQSGLCWCPHSAWWSTCHPRHPWTPVGSTDWYTAPAGKTPERSPGTHKTFHWVTAAQSSLSLSLFLSLSLQPKIIEWSTRMYKTE